MKGIYLPRLILLQLSIVIGCAKPDRVAVFKSPDPELFYTVEMYNGHGAASSDFTRVYAHLEHDGKTDKKLVLDGEYLIIGKVIWVSVNDVGPLYIGRPDQFVSKWSHAECRRFVQDGPHSFARELPTGERKVDSIHMTVFARALFSPNFRHWGGMTNKTNISHLYFHL